MSMTVREAKEIIRDDVHNDALEMSHARGFLDAWNQMAPVIESQEKLLRAMQRINGGDDCCIIDPHKCINHVSIQEGKEALAQVEKIKGEKP